MENRKKVATIDDVNLALSAKEVKSKIDVDGKGNIKIVERRLVSPTGQEIFSPKGQKLTRRISAVIDGKNIVFEKGTLWENIDAIYKCGPKAVNWKKEYFEE